jgi:hypothetical protein
MSTKSAVAVVLASRAARGSRGSSRPDLDPRAICLAFDGIAPVEPLRIVVKIGVGQFDKLRSLLLTALIRVPSTAANS